MKVLRAIWKVLRWVLVAAGGVLAGLALRKHNGWTRQTTRTKLREIEGKAKAVEDAERERLAKLPDGALVADGQLESAARERIRRARAAGDLERSRLFDALGLPGPTAGADTNTVGPRDIGEH